MQSAVNELHAIAVSAAIHSGWSQPRWLKPPTGAPFAIIERDRSATPAGGHAFAIVGYDEHGFLVQNSWGTDWGDRGFAILTYDDWLRSAYDAWVARPGATRRRRRLRRVRSRRAAASSSAAART